MKPLLRSLVPEEILAMPYLAGEPGFRGRQLLSWIFPHGALEWNAMSNIPAALRERLAHEFDLAGLIPEMRLESLDGTRKFLFRLREGETVESVIIPMTDHATFCISSQVGCAMACNFCATARGGLVRNLEAAEIVEQILRLAADLDASPFQHFGDRQFNVVFMGMGEPLDNWENVRQALKIMMHPQGLAISKRRIQISTSGPGDGMNALLADNPGIGLTLSLGGSNDRDRRRVMPVPGKTPVTDAVDLAARFARENGRRATLAWVLIAEKTDHARQAEELVKLARRGAFKVNLIPLNPLDEGKLTPSAEDRVLAFQKILTDAGVPAFVRASGGRDIAAACGQLRRRRKQSGA